MRPKYPYVITPLGDYETTHPPRKFDWPRTAKDLHEITRRGLGADPVNGIPATPPTKTPGVSDEPMGAAEKPSSGRDVNPRHHADHAAVALMYGAGSTIHNDDGQRCKVPGLGSVQLACADAVVQVWKDWARLVKAGSIHPKLNEVGSYVRGPQAALAIQHVDRYVTGQPENPTGATRSFGMITGRRQVVIPVQPGSRHQVIPQGGWRLVEQGGPHGQILVFER